MDNKKNGQKKVESEGLRVGTDLVASCIVGTVVGISLDKFFDTKPIMLIICLILGLITAIYMIGKYK